MNKYIFSSRVHHCGNAIIKNLRKNTCIGNAPRECSEYREGKRTHEYSDKRADILLWGDYIANLFNYYYYTTGLCTAHVGVELREHESPLVLMKSHPRPKISLRFSSYEFSQLGILLYGS